jgi:alcohol dehydrogenase
VFYGPRAIERWPARIREWGNSVLLVTGGSAYDRSEWGARFERGWQGVGLKPERLRVHGEPSPGQVDEAVAKFHSRPPEVVVAIGGGSAIDFAKAIAALIPSGRSVMTHLEGVGKGIPFAAPAIPFLAAPTTAGSGAEATMNSVLTRVGRRGFKKSFRHPALVAREVLLDPAVLESLPMDMITADGMDARTQLIESWMSPRSNEWTSAWIRRYLPGTACALERWVSGDPALRYLRVMQNAAFASGVVLARTGLGAVHGLAAALGALCGMPHGMACGTLLAAGQRINARAMEERHPDGPEKERLQQLARLDGAVDRERWLDSLENSEARMKMPRLSGFGVREDDLDELVQASSGNSMRTNPIRLQPEELRTVLSMRL